MKYCDLLTDTLVELGFTHCFFVPGGNIMHLVNSCDQRMTCIGVVHEVAAAIAAEYFNAVAGGRKAFALVTAGPGLTNAITGMAGAHTDSHELLVIGGQVKTTDLSHGVLRQKGIQEIDGIEIVKPITKRAERLDRPVDHETFASWVRSSWEGRPGCVFIESCLDVQGRDVDPATFYTSTPPAEAPPALPAAASALQDIEALLQSAERPVILLGGGVSYDTSTSLLSDLARLGVPLMTTWNGADRIPSDHPMYFGRPNTFGQRAANILINQADLVLTLGTRLGLQQTGFNWQQFVPGGKVVQVDIDPAELTKGHPNIHKGFSLDANAVLRGVAAFGLARREDWIAFCCDVRDTLPVCEAANRTRKGFVSPYDFVAQLSTWTKPGDLIVPCSSGNAFISMMQVYRQQAGQRVVTNKSLASMGYGLSGAIGAALAFPDRRTVLVEGDGGFSQNLQELGTASLNHLNLKIFIYDDSGYASIRTTQRNYFNGRYFGCDRATGLGLPNWDKLFDVYDIPSLRLTDENVGSLEMRDLFDAPGPAAFIVSIDPEQTYYPKIESRIKMDGFLESNPLYLPSPPLSSDVARKVFRFIEAGPTA